MKIDKTERLDIQSAESVADNSFKGSLQKGENLKGYIVDSLLSVSSGEAEIFIGNKNKETAVIKYYYPNFKPKEDILQKIHKLNHPDIITLHEYGYHNSRFFEIMEYAEGGTLSDKDANGKYKYLPMEEEQVIQIISETINAFKYFHEKGIIHRDIKPANLFFKNSDGSDILVGDFGISSELDVEGGMSKRMTSTIALSDGYAAPELYGIAKEDNKAKILIGPEVDYYALGITVYELLTGANPFAGRNTLHIMRDTIEGRVIEDLLSRDEAKKFSMKIIKLLQGLLTVRHDKRWGYNEVSEWLKGKDVEVFTEVHKPGIPPLKFDGRVLNSIDEVVSAIYADRVLGKKLLMRADLEKWASKFDDELSTYLTNLRELNIDDQQKLSTLIFHLDPSKPCRIDDHHSVSNINDLMELLRNYQELMWDIILSEKQSDLYPWLQLHYMPIYEQIIKLSEVYKKDKKTSDKVLLLNRLYIALAGEIIKPFPEDHYEISAIDDLINLPEKYRGVAVEQLKNNNSILYLWLLSQKIPQGFSWDWLSMEKTWENLIEILSGNIAYIRAEKERIKIEKGQAIKIKQNIRKFKFIAVSVLIIFGVYKYYKTYIDNSFQTFELNHYSLVRSIAFSPDDRYALIGHNSTITLFGVSRGDILKIMDGDTRIVNTVTLSPDAKFALSGSSTDNTIKLLDISNGTIAKTLNGHTKIVNTVKFSPDGRYALSGSNDNTIKLWDISKGTIVKTLKGHLRAVNTVEYSPDGKYVLSGSDDYTIRLWDISTGNLLKIFKEHTNAVTSVVFSRDGKYVFSGSRDETIKMWNALTGDILKTFKGHSSIISSIAFSQDGKYVISGSNDRTVKLWDIQTGNVIETFRGHKGDVISVAFSLDGRYAFSGSQDGTIKLWDTR